MGHVAPAVGWPLLGNLVVLQVLGILVGVAFGTAQTVLLSNAWPTAEQWAQLGTTTAIWVLLPLAIGCWQIVRREVK